MPDDVQAADPPSDSMSKRLGSETATQIYFILDSGSTVHATGDASLLNEARAPGPGDVASLTGRDGKKLDVVAVGPLITAGFAIPDVHCAPELGPGRTLVSVSQLSLLGLAVMFTAAGCLIVNRTGAVVGKGRMQGDDDDDGFYHLDYLKIPIPRDAPEPPPPAPRDDPDPPPPAP